jgi:hypothetical protein
MHSCPLASSRICGDLVGLPSVSSPRRLRGPFFKSLLHSHSHTIIDSGGNVTMPLPCAGHIYAPTAHLSLCVHCLGFPLFYLRPLNVLLLVQLPLCPIITPFL